MGDDGEKKIPPERNSFLGIDEPKRNVEKQPSKIWIYLIGGILCICAVIGIALGIYFGVKSTVKPDGSWDRPGSSCLDLKENGIQENGYYVIKLNDVEEAFEVFCEMEAVYVGGWTLVAALHQEEDDCNRDKWRSDDNSYDSRNWENKKTFGNLSTATSSDYKNPAYFAMKASNVMIRHLSKNSSIMDRGYGARLEYYTDNKFLAGLGGNLYSAFSKNSLTPIDRESSTVQNPSVIEQMLDALEANGSNIIKDNTPPFYKYVYNETTPNRLSNGGNNLFDSYGMKISLTTPTCDLETIDYGQNYSECNNLSSRKSHPFFALLQTGSPDPVAANETDYVAQEYLYTIDSGRPSSDIRKTLYSFANLKETNFSMKFRASRRLSNSIPSYMDFIFTVYNEELWNSTEITPGSIATRASHHNAVYGYTMIAREAGGVDSEFPMDGIAQQILIVMSQFSTIDVEAMLDALANNSQKIGNITYPAPYVYYYDESPQDSLTGQGIFTPSGMQLKAILPNNKNQTIQYGASYRLENNLVELSSRKSFPFFALMKTDNPNLSQAVGFQVSGGRPHSDRRIQYIRSAITIEEFALEYSASCAYSSTVPSICDVFFYLYNKKDWNSQKVFPNSDDTTIINDNDAGPDFLIYTNSRRMTFTNAIVGYTLLSREAGSVDYEFNLASVMMNILEIISKFPKIGLPCSIPTADLVTPVLFRSSGGDTLRRQIPPKFQPYADVGFLQLRARTFNGNSYALCAGVSVESCEPQYLCLGEVWKSNSSLTKNCDQYLNWPPNGTSYTFPDELFNPSEDLPDIRSNILIFYK